MDEQRDIKKFRQIEGCVDGKARAGTLILQVLHVEGTFDANFLLN